MLIDTHAHLYAEQFDEDRPAMIERAIAAGVGKFFLPNIDSSSIDIMLRMEKDYPGICYPMMGLHPCSVQANYREELSLVRAWLDRREFIAIGEIGIDLYWDKTFIEEQKDAFLTQVEWAESMDLPVVIHSRESIDLLIELLQNRPNSTVGGVFHCFTGSLDQAKAIMDLGFSMGIGGVVTFKNSGLDAIVPHIPLEYLVLETDSPYLAPVPYRGKRNESAYVRLIAEKLAIIRGESFETILKTTTDNALRIFKIKSL